MFECFKLNGIEYQACELIARQEIEIASHGAGRTEEAITAFIRHAYTRTDECPIEPWLLTAAQRYALIAIYLVQVEHGGTLELNAYQIGDAVAADYFNPYPNTDFTTLKIDMGRFQEQGYTFTPLLGWHADVIERVVRVIQKTSTPEQLLQLHVYYELGMMAAQMQIEDERNLPTDSSQTQLACDIVKERIDLLLGHSGADLQMFTHLFYGALDEMPDVMSVGASPDGLCVLPRAALENGGGETVQHPPVMFRAVSVLGENALRLGALIDSDD